MVCNLWGPIAQCPTDYFGNAAFNFHQPLENIPTKFNINSLVIMTQSIHNAVQRVLGNPEARDLQDQRLVWNSKTSWFEKHPWCLGSCSHGGTQWQWTFVKCMDNRLWDVKIGLDNRATMAAFFGILPNLIIEVPGDSVIWRFNNLFGCPYHNLMPCPFASLARKTRTWFPLMPL